MANKLTSTYERMGMAAMLPGLQRAAELLTAEVARFKALLADEWQQSADEDTVETQKAYWTNRASSSETQKRYWGAMSPAERAAEMIRRGMGGPKKPRKSGTGSYWDKLTPEERKKEMARRVLVREGKALPQRKDRTFRELSEAAKERKREIDRASKKRARAAKKAAGA